ncbi:CheR family methyltransferase [Rhizobium sp. LEGMi12c]
MLNQVMGISVVMRRMPRRVLRTLWAGMPPGMMKTTLVYRSGRYIYHRYSREAAKVQSHYTHFMRNPPLLEVLAGTLSDHAKESTLRVASIGCSTGAELYSTLYVLKAKRPDLNFISHGLDISSGVVEVAARGVYRPDQAAGVTGLYTAGRAEVSSDDVEKLSGIVEALPDGTVRVWDSLRKNITWLTADATDPKVADLIGEQDILIANNFMGPMDDGLAEKCLRNLMRLVVPGGYLVIDGIDLDVKMKVLKGSRFKPVLMRQDDIWLADESKKGWPWLRWSREPLNRNERGWEIRYSVIFHLAGQPNQPSNP